jgi:hypothetical protein
LFVENERNEAEKGPFSDQRTFKRIPGATNRILGRARHLGLKERTLEGPNQLRTDDEQSLYLRWHEISQFNTRLQTSIIRQQGWWLPLEGTYRKWYEQYALIYWKNRGRIRGIQTFNPFSWVKVNADSLAFVLPSDSFSARAPLSEGTIRFSRP